MKRIANVHTLILLMALCIAGCSTLGITSPQSFDQKLIYASGVNTSVLTGATAALRAHEISSEDHAQAMKLADEANTLIASAKLLSGTDPTAANAKLELATAVLTQLQTYLNSRKGR